MPVFTYRALTSRGRSVRGVIDADTPQMARQRLRSDGLFPAEIRETNRTHAKSAGMSRFRTHLTFRRNRTELLADSTRQAATLLSAGLPLVAALETVQEQAEDSSFRHTLALIREEVTKGSSYASALENHPDIYPDEYIHLVRAGEMAGALEDVLTRLADTLERRQQRHSKIVAALAYPAFMTLVGLSVVLFLLTFIVPTLSGLFSELGAALPVPTVILLTVSGIFRNYWWAVLLGVIILIVLGRKMMRSPSTYRQLESIFLRLPVFGALSRKLILAKAIRSLAVMVGGGVALTSALVVTAKGMGQSNFAKVLHNAAELVGQGRSLSDGLSSSHLFPPMVRRMVAVGESSGTLDKMLNRLAAAYEEETDRALTTLTALVEPTIILVMGVIVGFIVLAVLLPIFDLSGLVG